MKFWKHTLITAFAFLGISSTILYTSCTQDSCERLKCRNGGTCVNDFCQCPTGYEGTECEITNATKYLGVYYGNTQCNGLPPVLDTLTVGIVSNPNRVSIYQHSTKRYLETTVSGPKVTIQNNENSGFSNLELSDNGKATYYVEQTVNNKKSVCTFIGAKK